MPALRTLLTAALIVACAAGTTACASTPGPTIPVADTRTAPGPPDLSAQIDGLHRLDFMVGRWEGSGYAIGRGGVRSDFTQSEVVTYKLDGALLAVDGDGRAADDPARSVHSAFALATFDPAAGTYRWEAFSDGNRVETELVVADRGWQWSFQPVPEVTVRYTATFTDTEWVETGEVSLDGGATWETTLEMTLTRVA